MTVAGRFNGNYYSPDNPDGNYGAAVPGYPIGSWLNLLIIGWSANIGSTWSEAQSWYNLALTGNQPSTGWFGMSSVGQNLFTGGGAQPVGQVFGTYAGQLPGFTLYKMDPIPEPSAFALLGIAASSLAIFRRRIAMTATFRQRPTNQGAGPSGGKQRLGAI